MTYQAFTDGSSSRNRKTIGTSFRGGKQQNINLNDNQEIICEDCQIPIS